MLKNPRSKNIMNELKWLNKLEIPVHTQIVLCPGINDNEELEKTLADLAFLSSNVLSIAVVPVGVTKYRKDDRIAKFDNLNAEKVIDQLNKFNRKLGYNLAFASDEFYILTGNDFPDSASYNDFAQLDDGVGTSRILLDDFMKNKHKLPEKLFKPKKFTIATGEIACKALNPIIAELNRIAGLEINLMPIKSNFWGESVTVSGLITGQDLIDNLLSISSEIENLIIPSIMLRKHTYDFLDDLTLQDIEEKLQIPIAVIKNCYSIEELIEIINE